MRFLFSLIILVIAINIHSQSEVQVEGVIVVGDQTNATPKEGTIKFANGIFMGFDGNKWVTLSPQEKYILGPSNVTSDGSFQFGSLTGLEAATAICKNSYPNEPTAHFYTAGEIDQATSYGNINGVTSNTEFWTVIHTFHGFDTSNSASNNCYNFLYETGHIARGTTVTFALNVQPETLVGNYTNYRVNKACSTKLAIICGR